MAVRLYVGNFAYSTSESDLRQLFAQAGPVAAINLVKDGVSGKSRGFAFVTMGSEAGAAQALQKFHAYSLAGRRLTVNSAEQSKAPAAYQSRLSAFGATSRSPQLNTLKRGKAATGYQSKLGAFGAGNSGPTPPQRRGRDQRH